MKHLSIIFSETINHKDQRYDTAGDYWKHPDGRHDVYKISRLPQGWKAELAVLIHEIVEFQLCKEAGIKEKDITKFDIESGHLDPGTIKNCPYFKQHKLATEIEKYVIKKLGLNWKEYNKSFEKLCAVKKK
jgi:hypothetical protein